MGSSGTDRKQIAQQILAALGHSEADEGLYFRNFYQLHEEDQRSIVEGDQEEILEVVKDLIDQGKIRVDDSGAEVVFFLKT